MASLPPRVQSWKDRGHMEVFRGHNIHCFYQDQEVGGEQSTSSNNIPLKVICHGYPTCSYDWKTVIDNEKLKSHPILICDFLGFGLSDKPSEHHYTLEWQADLVEELIMRHNKDKEDRKVILIGHDMGTSVVAELIARDLEGKLNQRISFIGAFLFNGSMIQERANFILGQKILRTPVLGPIAALLTLPSLFKWQLGKVFSTQHPLTGEEGEDQWALMKWNDGHRINHKLIQYTFERVQKAERWHGAVRAWGKPIVYGWGMEDPVCGHWQLEGWKEMRPSAKLWELPGLGHYPQIEDPQRFAELMEAVLEFLGKQ